jgi:hypothetical protein
MSSSRKTVLKLPRLRTKDELLKVCVSAADARATAQRTLHHAARPP